MCTKNCSCQKCEMLDISYVVIRDDTRPLFQSDHRFVMFKCQNDGKFDFNFENLKKGGRFDSDLIFLSESENAQKLFKGEL